MQAIRVSKSDAGATSTTLETVPIPSPPPNHILVKVLATTINPSDILNSKGNFHETTFPRTLGRDFAGVVTAGSEAWVGKDVFGTSGDTVSYTIDGAHAEYLVVPDDSVVVKPEGLSFVQCAAMGVSWTTAGLALKKAEPLRNDTILVLGGKGNVGSAVVQLARAQGFTTLVGGRGAGYDVDTTNDEGLMTAVELTQGKGPDIIVDTVGDATLIRRSLDILAVHGRLSYISAGLTPDGLLTFDMKSVYRKEQSLLGSNSLLHSAQKMAGSLEEVIALWKKGAVEFPSDKGYVGIDLAEAVEFYHGKKGPRGSKFVIAPHGMP